VTRFREVSTVIRLPGQDRTFHFSHIAHKPENTSNNEIILANMVNQAISERYPTLSVGFSFGTLLEMRTIECISAAKEVLESS
jgi:hypothetical protein